MKERTSRIVVFLAAIIVSALLGISIFFHKSKLFENTSIKEEPSILGLSSAELSSRFGVPYLSDGLYKRKVESNGTNSWIAHYRFPKFYPSISLTPPRLTFMQVHTLQVIFNDQWIATNAISWNGTSAMPMGQ